MKKLMLVVFVLLLLAGCATVRPEVKELADLRDAHIELLQKDLAESEDEVALYEESIAVIRAEAQEFYDNTNQETKLIKLLVDSLILQVEPSVADSILREHGMTYTLPDGTILGGE